MRELIATGFEVAGLVLLSFAAAVYLWRFDPALGLAGAAAAALVEAALLSALTPGPRGDDE